MRCAVGVWIAYFIYSYTLTPTRTCGGALVQTVVLPAIARSYTQEPVAESVSLASHGPKKLWGVHMIVLSFHRACHFLCRKCVICTPKGPFFQARAEPALAGAECLGGGGGGARKTASFLL